MRKVLHKTIHIEDTYIHGFETMLSALTPIKAETFFFSWKNNEDDRKTFSICQFNR